MIKEFPKEQDFGKLFKEASDFTSAGQDLETYCLMKISKIKKLQLNISEEKLVDLVAYGIADENIRRTVQAARYKDITNLKRCLSVFNVTPKDSKLEKNKDEAKYKIVQNPDNKNKKKRFR